MHVYHQLGHLHASTCNCRRRRCCCCCCCQRGVELKPLRSLERIASQDSDSESETQIDAGKGEADSASDDTDVSDDEVWPEQAETDDAANGVIDDEDDADDTGATASSEGVQRQAANAVEMGYDSRPASASSMARSKCVPVDGARVRPASAGMERPRGTWQTNSTCSIVASIGEGCDNTHTHTHAHTHIYI